MKMHSVLLASFLAAHAAAQECSFSFECPEPSNCAFSKGCLDGQCCESGALSLGDACTSESEGCCPRNTFCVTKQQGEGMECASEQLSDGSTCAGFGECADNECVEGVCQEPLSNDSPCSGNSSCMSQFCCDATEQGQGGCAHSSEDKRCNAKAPDGTACTYNEQCAGYCDESSCAPLKAGGAMCAVGDECESGFCQSDNTCWDMFGDDGGDGGDGGDGFDLSAVCSSNSQEQQLLRALLLGLSSLECAFDQCDVTCDENDSCNWNANAQDGPTCEGVPMEDPGGNLFDFLCAVFGRGGADGCAELPFCKFEDNMCVQNPCEERGFVSYARGVIESCGEDDASTCSSACQKANQKFALAYMHLLASSNVNTEEALVSCSVDLLCALPDDFDPDTIEDLDPISFIPVCADQGTCGPEGIAAFGDCLDAESEGDCEAMSGCSWCASPFDDNGAIANPKMTCLGTPSTACTFGVVGVEVSLSSSCPTVDYSSQTEEVPAEGDPAYAIPVRGPANIAGPSLGAATVLLLAGLLAQ